MLGASPPRDDSQGGYHLLSIALKYVRESQHSHPEIQRQYQDAIESLRLALHSQPDVGVSIDAQGGRVRAARLTRRPLRSPPRPGRRSRSRRRAARSHPGRSPYRRRTRHS
jgi:hypothetical protein